MTHDVLYPAHFILLFLGLLWPELKDLLSKNYNVLPSYEKGIFDHEFVKAHSLHGNAFLHCRWLEYQRIHISGKPEPFEFPHIDDFHFYNYNACYKPELSIAARPDNRYWLKNGPGYDKYGELPIPSDVGYRRTGMMIHKGKIKKIKNKPKKEKKIMKE